ncbi:MAG: hypothetical protein GTO22_09650 [Gemmatimonadales bacterium]|nr:hypothetical protein [Gemmatimonadales bacterium]NIN10807.1 hypothetical protein [Gemmatimonadales bacterium]
MSVAGVQIVASSWIADPEQSDGEVAPMDSPWPEAPIGATVWIAVGVNAAAALSGAPWKNGVIQPGISWKADTATPCSVPAVPSAAHHHPWRTDVR